VANHRIVRQSKFGGDFVTAQSVNGTPIQQLLVERLQTFERLFYHF
jgi:hypothetical protein